MPTPPVKVPRDTGRVTRRWLAAAAVVIAALVTACAGAGDGAVGGRPYTDVQGHVTSVPERPTRIVALSEPTLDGLLALGVTPVAATAGRGQGGMPSYLSDRAEGIASVGILGQPSIERVAALAPDLIVADGTSVQDEAILDKLRLIAPTVYVSRTGQDWRTAFSSLADVVGRADEGRRLLDEFDARVRDIRSRLGANAGARISIVRWGGFGLPSVILKELAAGRTLTALGLRRPPSQDREGPGHSVPISLENIDQLDGDWIFFGSLGNGGAAGGVSDTPADLAAARQAIRWAEDTPGFLRLAAVRAGHVVPVDGSAWTSAGGYLAEQVVLDDVERTLATPG
ncbi:MAG: iron-siderophore ABC transporter substrate-binding protein [Thermoleophilia bacterium]